MRDSITLFQTQGGFQQLVIANGQIGTFVLVALPWHKSPKWYTYRLGDVSFPWESNAARGHWRWRFLGIGIYEYTSDLDWKWKQYSIQIRSVVIPLTLLSAWLLLSTPRVKPSAKKPGGKS